MRFRPIIACVGIGAGHECGEGHHGRVDVWGPDL